MKKNAAFTLIEILVVMTIIGLLAGAATVTYTAFTKKSRDARRQVDLEQIRGALETYKSSVGNYPEEDRVTFNCPSSGGLTDDSSNTYMSKIPNDPKCPDYSYYYDVDSNGDYTIGAYLETGSGSCGGSCTGSNCNYCLGPYGQQ